MNSRKLIAALFVVAAAPVMSGCSGSFSIGGTDWPAEAEDLISGELAKDGGFESLKPTCDDAPTTFEVGDQFECTAKTPEGDVVKIVATQDKEDHLKVESINVVVPSALPEFEKAGAQALAEANNLKLPASALDCGDKPVIGDVPLLVNCKLTDPADGKVYDAEMTIKDIDEGTFDIEVK